MEKYEHIKKMEEILNKHGNLIKELSLILEKIEKENENYDKLIDYYYSEQRDIDLNDDNNDMIPNTIKRGVLTEDSIYNLMIDYYDMGIKMLEIGTRILKK
ncbi:DUF4298 domain-containing protein [Oceanivirga salmonicida]|uniref:DUF4298 domain-containing protein n=1 Tax=Oceanivirga salmonicida TaxID=1769291 RepID=UPI00082D4A10|nr:DUF4298 domain-containing protein [Oceanivirga salmonicida]